jgi:hypothetical protein
MVRVGLKGTSVLERILDRNIGILRALLADAGLSVGHDVAW